jgi:osmotically-inducible protein OsmY
MRKLLGLVLIGLAISVCNSVLAGDKEKDKERDKEFSQLYAQEERRTAEIISNDEEIERLAFNEIQGDDDLRRQSHVNVNVFNGLALVSGEAVTAEVKNKILEIIRTIDNVKMVRDGVIVEALTDGNSHIDDRQLTQQIKAALTQIHTLPNFSSKMIKVVPENGIVYLMGLVSKEEGAVVVNVVRLQSGVKQIVTVFEYTN